MSGLDKERSRWWQRLNIRWPWLKIALVFVLMILVAGTEKGWWIGRAGINEKKVPGIMMGSMVEVPEMSPPATAEFYKGKKLVALTFDDGPSSATTPKLLDLLKQKKVYATFFVLGRNAERNPELVKREVREGHEVGSHTMSHQKLSKLPEAAVADDVKGAKAIIEKITGERVKLTRPPYGMISRAVREQAGTPLALWTVDTLDWKSKNAEAVKKEILRSTFDGAVILMHDIYDSTVTGVGMAIDELRKQGYDFVTFSDLAKIRKVNLKNGEAYGSFRP